MSSGGVVGLSNNARGKLIDGWVGISNNKAKLLKGWIGDANNVPKLIYSSVLPGSGKLGIHFAPASTVHPVKTTDDGINFTESSIIFPTESDRPNLSYLRGVERWLFARGYYDDYVTATDKLSGVLTYYDGASGIVNGYRFVTTGVTTLSVYKVNADLTETLIGTVPLFTSKPSSYTNSLVYRIASDGNGNFCCAFIAVGSNINTDYEYQTSYVSYVLFSISGSTITVRKTVRNTSTSSSSGEAYVSPTCVTYFTGSGFLVYSCQWRYNSSSDTWYTSSHRMYYNSNTSPYTSSTVTLPSAQSDEDFGTIVSRNDNYIYYNSGYRVLRSNKTGGTLTDITSTVKVFPIRSDGDYFYNDWMKQTSSGVWSMNRARPGDAAATVITTSAPTTNVWSSLAYKNQDGTYQQY